jgi:hypothetical protein
MSIKGLPFVQSGAPTALTTTNRVSVYAPDAVLGASESNATCTLAPGFTPAAPMLDAPGSTRVRGSASKSAGFSKSAAIVSVSGVMRTIWGPSTSTTRPVMSLQAGDVA